MNASQQIFDIFILLGSPIVVSFTLAFIYGSLRELINETLGWKFLRTNNE